MQGRRRRSPLKTLWVSWLLVGLSFITIVLGFPSGLPWMQAGVNPVDAVEVPSQVAELRLEADWRTQSADLGKLAERYEHQQRWQLARSLTQQALTLAQQAQAFDLMYLWEWQLGRILKAQFTPLARRPRVDRAATESLRQQAIAAYEAALDTLRFLRSEPNLSPSSFSSIGSWVFSEQIEPVYRDLVDLLLQPSSTVQELELAQQTIEQLRRAELANFLGSEALNYQPDPIESLDSQAAVLYPILLGDRLEVLLSIPHQPLRHYATLRPQADLENTLEQFLASLNPAMPKRRRLRFSYLVYNWLIRPAEPLLTRAKTQTLVFVMDGFLRNLPLAALYDGQHYLVEKYAIALAPGLELLAPQPTFQASHFPQASDISALFSNPFNLLMAGLTESRQGFSPLPGVAQEIDRIRQAFPAKVLLNQEFTKDNFQAEINQTQFSIVHVATHGEFSSQADQTFLLAWDQKIQVKELQGLLRLRQREQFPIELLVLSACQTAMGDRYAALGLAGMALQSGARSTLATLWSVNDNSTAVLMAKFYEFLKQESITQKARSLQQAQISLLQSPDYSHPFYWAPFVLVGNWL